MTYFGIEEYINLMPFVHDQKVVDRAKLLWTSGGYSPEEIVTELIRETREGGLLEGCRVPTKATGRQLMQHWAKVHRWNPHWKEARSRLVLEEINDYGITGIKDPIWHLVQIHAKRWMRDHTLTERTLDNLMNEIETEYEPGLNALRLLRENLGKRTHLNVESAKAEELKL